MQQRKISKHCLSSNLKGFRSIHCSRLLLHSLVDVAIEVDGELLPAFGLLVHPDGNADTWALEFTIALFINGDLALFPSEDVGPNLPLVLRADVALDLTGSRVGHDTGESIGSVMGSASDEANAIGVVKVIVLFAVGVEFASQRHIGKLVTTRRWFRLLAFASVEIAVEETGVAVLAEEDQGIGKRLEETLDGSLDGLTLLGVVVLDDGDGVDGHCLDEGLVEDGAQIGGLLFAERGEVVQQRRVVQRELLVHHVQPSGKVVDITSPELADVELVAALLVDVIDPFSCEALREVLDSIEAEPGQTHLLCDPRTPVLNVIADFRVRVVEIGKHQEVSIAVFVVDAFTPALVFALDLEDGVAIVLGVEVGSGKVIPVVLLLRVLVSSAREVESEPGLDLLDSRDFLVAVWQQKYQL